MPICGIPHEFPGGPTVLTLDLYRLDVSTCPVVLQDATATNGWVELGKMSIGEASQIGMGVGLVWAIAWGIKQIVRTIRTTDTDLH